MLNVLYQLLYLEVDHITQDQVLKVLNIFGNDKSHYTEEDMNRKCNVAMDAVSVSVLITENYLWNIAKNDYISNSTRETLPLCF